MKRLVRILISVAVLFGLVFGTVTLVRLANGDFAGDYALSGTFPRAGEGLNPGSAVVFRGVQVGRVSTISLAPEPSPGFGPHGAVVQGADQCHRDDRAGEPVRCGAGVHLDS